jgi:hypothetical protein
VDNRDEPGPLAGPIESSGSLTADAQYFDVTNQLEAYEGGTAIFAREWSVTIPRDQL